MLMKYAYVLFKKLQIDYKLIILKKAIHLASSLYITLLSEKSFCHSKTLNIFLLSNEKTSS